ncbi:MAG TPA: acyltransferase [Xanthobacteraceae bacterium]|jgi:peptidoglycan/LPS O-acetylase OafA/YrhL
MGALRFILAMSVAYGHAGDFLGFPLIPGDTAVQCFYAVSGFYMALVLNEKYRPESSSYFLFISNRFARLFPAYATVLCLTLLFAAVSSPELPFLARWHSLPALDWWSAAFLIGSQILMWGQDLYFYLTLKAGALAFWPDFHTAPEPIIPLLVIPQGWTLGLEFSFYLIAPFIVRRPGAAIVTVLAASLVLRLLLQLAGLSGDPWSYRFFPSELAVFLLGALGYCVYRSTSTSQLERTHASQSSGSRPPCGATPDETASRPPPRKGEGSRLFVWRGLEPQLARMFVLAALCVGAALLINRWNGLSRVASVAFFVLAVLAIPLLFRATGKWELDRLLGELSYPIYICHVLVIWWLDRVLAPGAGVLRGFTILAITVALSWMLYRLVDRPIDAWRQRRFARERALVSAAVPAAQPGV